MTKESAEREESCGAKQAGPYRRDVVGLDLRTLVSLPERFTFDSVGAPEIEVIVGVGCLKPGAAITIDLCIKNAMV